MRIAFKGLAGAGLLLSVFSAFAGHIHDAAFIIGLGVFALVAAGPSDER